MGIFDKAKNKAEELARKDPNLADKGLSEAGNEAKQMTGGRFGNQIDEGVRDGQNWVGQQAGSQNPNQPGGYQDPNQPGYQDPTQGGYDPNQGRDQEENQG